MDKTPAGQMAAQLAALRQRAAKTCPHCGREFQALKIGVYCSKVCSRAAKHRRKVIRNKKPAG